MTGPELSATQRLAGARASSRQVTADIDSAAAATTENEEHAFLNYAVQHAKDTAALLEAARKQRFP